MKHILGLSLLLALTACSPKSDTLATQSKPQDERVEVEPDVKVDDQVIDWITMDGGNLKVEFNPQIDILFVVDNSDSMKTAQANLKLNIERFTQGIRNNKMIDYHIGIISTWDAGQVDKKAAVDPYTIGELRHIKDDSGQKFNKRFITRKEGNPQLIASTIDIGILPLAQGGPQNEEFFAPLMSALEKSGPGAVNDGFFRKDAQLVVVLMTDADEYNKRYSPEQVQKVLSNFKSGNNKKISVYGVLVRASDEETKKDYILRIHPDYHPECFDSKRKNNGTCKPFAPVMLEDFVIAANVANGNTEEIREKFLIPITTNFGKDLARIGDDITAKTLEKTVYLDQRPMYENGRYQIEVKYGTSAQLTAKGGQLIPQGKAGWTYDSKDVSITLSGHTQYTAVEGGHFQIRIKPVPTAR